VTDEDQSTDHHVGDGNEGTSLGTTAARGFLWANLGIVVRYGSGLVLAAVLARTLSPAAYAVMVTLMIVTFYFDNALDLGMGAALVYEQEKGISRRVQVAFTANVALAGILAGFFVTLVYLVVTRYSPWFGVEYLGMVSNKNAVTGANLVDLVKIKAENASLYYQNMVALSHPMANRVGWFSVSNISAGLFGLPVGFIVMYVVSLMTPAPSAEMRKFIDEVRRPRGKTMMEEKTS
jgi:O-antigen/teichoic acid export membrane protein